jgi:four helix bundle protein
MRVSGEFLPFCTLITLSLQNKSLQICDHKTLFMILREGPIVRKSLSFSISIIKYCDFLNDKRKFIISNQLLKSGTSIGANVFEAQYAESRLDFIHKMKIALKEANETLYWLILCGKFEDLSVQQETIDELNEMMAILSKIIITSKKRLN